MSTTLPLFDEPETPETTESTTELRIADEPIVVRRSDLENYANCPLAARMAGSVGKLAEAGEQCHQIIAGAIRKFVTTKGNMKSNDLADFMVRGSWESRGDVNQETVDAMRPGAWSVARYIADLHWSNILAFDGGEDLTASYTYEDEEGSAFTADVSCSGQFDADIDVLHPITDELQAMRLTAEFDLLHSVRYPNRLQLVDWKTGHAKWTDAMVESSFQFQFYSYLTLASFPTMDAVDVIIFNVRHNTRTAGVRFLRSDMDRIRGRIEEACRTYLMNYLIPLDQVEARPSREGCQFCDQAARCTVCDWDIRDTAQDPPRALQRAIVLEQALKCLKTGMNAECKKSGDDIQSGNDKYGMKKPRSRIVPGFYSASASIEDGGEE
ncbi:PD-(D/E)XK nuclease superfamily [uncultured Caudovirales phage]|uniref:PD-(D/E)XK nuclease superfamily n=1 Tax=uncultured Caudovirales phage TaxID=2100421 RepID=A0A6J5R3U0_9CAUD|nr:PD-(D/E)XK nuclease superfamily [uncultured Caudovirales phage]